jgi:hypothetical protein
MHLRDLMLGVLALALVAGAGCESKGKPVKVEGTVTLDGKPLSGASVTFNPVGGGRPSVGTTDSSGHFQLTTFNTGDGALPGDYKVTVRKDDGDSSAGRADVAPSQGKLGKGDDYTKAMMGYAKKAAEKKKSPSQVPVKYSDLKETPLQYRIPHEGPINIEISSK